MKTRVSVVSRLWESFFLPLFFTRKAHGPPVIDGGEEIGKFKAKDETKGSEVLE